ncbi:MAG: nucleotidyltransferase family protein [Flavobacteriaceae bacterium]
MQETNMNIAVLILAAGRSSRMGQSKQLLPWKTTTLLGNAIETALGIKNADVFVVLGAHCEIVKAHIRKSNVVCLEHTDWEKGLGSSLAFGMGSIVETKKTYSAVLILLCDQPLIDTVYLATMVDTYLHNGKGIVATAYANRVGVPAIFETTYFSELMNLSEDKGAKSIIENHKNDVLAISPAGKEIDLDTMAEYQNLILKVPQKK